ncbi:MAG: hypothetical protein K2K73_02960 [Ureaplasma sp.]|nr:hypothetical protein [Ureaplasma sp.]
MLYTNSKKDKFAFQSLRTSRIKIDRVTARVISVDFENKKINLDFFQKPGFCLFKDVGILSNGEIARIFKVNSVHTFAKMKYYPHLNATELSYQKVHPETLKQGIISIIPTYSGYKNLKKFLLDLIREEDYEENSNHLG